MTKILTSVDLQLVVSCGEHLQFLLAVHCTCCWNVSRIMWQSHKRTATLTLWRPLLPHRTYILCQKRLSHHL